MSAARRGMSAARRGMSPARRGGRRLWLVAGAVALLLAGIVSAYASSQPDGLERVAEDKGFLEAADDHDLGGSPLADYGVEGVDDDRLSVGLAGAIGVVLTLAVGGGLFWLVRKRDGEDEGEVDGRTEDSRDRTPAGRGG